PPPLRAAVQVPGSLERALHRALAKDPLERFETVDAFADALSADIVTTAPAPVRLPVAGAGRRANNVPIAINPLLGRDDDVRTVLALLRRDGARLLTLFGPGGVGKTRLVLEVASRAEDFFPGGTYFVPLAEVRDTPTMEARIAQAIGLRGADANTADALRA